MQQNSKDQMFMDNTSFYIDTVKKGAYSLKYAVLKDILEDWANYGHGTGQSAPSHGPAPLIKMKFIISLTSPMLISLSHP